MSLDSPLLSGGSPRATLKTVYDAISDSFMRSGVREGDVAHFRCGGSDCFSDVAQPSTAPIEGCA